MERDPNGKNPHDGGAKLDAGKNRLGLVLGGFARALTEVGRVGTYGAGKYTEDGWITVPDGEARYTDAMLRHLMAEMRGEGTDPDTGLLHAAHVAWNALARLDLMLRAQAPELDFPPLEQAPATAPPAAGHHQPFFWLSSGQGSLGPAPGHKAG